MREDRWQTEIRAGVAVPDWQVVTSPVAERALSAILRAFDAPGAWRGYTAAEDAVRSAILRHFAVVGRAPSPGELSAATALPEEEVDDVLAQLRQRDLVVTAAGRLTGAYPLTERATDHRVGIADRTVHAMCAVDALGVGALFGRDAEVFSFCRDCRSPIHVALRGEGTRVAAVAPASSIVWSGIRPADGTAADTLCTVIAFFCGDDHADAWRRAHHPGIAGYRLTVEEGLQVGRALFGPMLRAPRDRAAPGVAAHVG